MENAQGGLYHNRALHRGRCHVRGATASLCHVQASPAATTNGFTVNSESTAVSATALSTCRRQHDGCQRGYHPQLRNCWCSACWYMWLGAHRMWLGAHRMCTRVQLQISLPPPSGTMYTLPTPGDIMAPTARQARQSGQAKPSIPQHKKAKTCLFGGQVCAVAATHTHTDTQPDSRLLDD